MNIQSIAREIGLFETALNLESVHSSAEVIQKVGDSMPLPETGTKERIIHIAKWLLASGKKKFLFLTPEIALIEEISKDLCTDIEIIIALPTDMEPDVKDRLKHNIPRGIHISLLEEPYFPESFFPSNSMIVVCGYAGGDREMVLSDTYRMIQHYCVFLGKKIFVPYIELPAGLRYNGWLALNRQQINGKWRYEL